MGKLQQSISGRRRPSPRRGEIYLANLDPTVGHEIQKTRPALIIQNDISNRNTPLTIVVPISSKVRSPLSVVQVLLAATPQTGLSVTSVALFNQIRAIDRARLFHRLGSVDQETMELADEAIKISLGVTKLD